MTLLPGIAVLVAAMLSPARIEAKLNAIQATLSSRTGPPPQYVVYDPETIIAAFRWDDEDGRNGIVVAYNVTEDGALHRLSTFKYGDDPTGLTLTDATGDDRPEVLVTGTPDGGPAPLEILTWDGKHLEEIGETVAGARFVDIDGDGVPEILTRSCCTVNDCGAQVAMPFVQRYGDDMLVDVASPGLEDFVIETKTTNEPETFDDDITLPNEAPKTVTLHLINGTRGGRHRAASVTVVDAQTGRDLPVDVPVTLESRCARVQLTVTGPRGTRIAILVMASHT